MRNIVLIIIVSVLCFPACLKNNDKKKAIKYRKATATIAVYQPGDKSGGYSSSGVLLKSKNGIILTAYHTLSHYDKGVPIMCYISSSGNKSIPLGLKDLDLLVKKKENQCIILEVLENLDIAVLQLLEDRNRGMKGIGIGLGGPPEIGDEIYGMYSLAPSHGLYYRGYLTAITKTGIAYLKRQNERSPSEMFVLSVPMGTGSSGSMVVNDRDRLIGIIIGGIITRAIAYAVPTELIYPRIKKYLE